MSRSSFQPPATRTSLLLRLRDTRDSAAWSEFAAVYEPVIYRLAQRRGCQDADAREIVQEVFLTVSQAIGRFDTEQAGSFHGWLSRIARNATVDRFRKRQQTEANAAAVPVEFLAGAFGSEDAALLEEFEQDRRRQLFRWSAAEVRKRTGELNWMAFWETSVEGRPIDEVAKELNVKPSTVHIARCRILKRIRSLVAERWEE